MRRFIRVDIEYDGPDYTPRFNVMDNIKRCITEDMPYVKVLFSRDSPRAEDLDEPRFRHDSK